MINYHKNTSNFKSLPDVWIKCCFFYWCEVSELVFGLRCNRPVLNVKYLCIK
jgi:hypothetical protein